MLNDEQAKNIREQVLKQIDSFPEDKRETAKKYVLSLSNEKLEEFLIKNKLIKQESRAESAECIFCSLSSKKIFSVIIYEDSENTISLEINPLSRGHAILIPKKHIQTVKELSKQSIKLAEKVGSKIVKKLKADNLQILPSDELKHAVINIIPLYKEQKLERKAVKVEDLEQIKKEIGILKRENKEEPKTTKQIIQESFKLERRIP